MTLQIIAGRMVALTWCEHFWSTCTIMDSEHQCFDSSDFTDSHLSINLGADPLQKDVQHQMAPSAFSATIAEYNDHNGSLMMSGTACLSLADLLYQLFIPVTLHMNYDTFIPSRAVQVQLY